MVVDDLAFGVHYAETLRLWRQRFDARRRGRPCSAHDEVFRRMWTFYLPTARRGSASGYLDVHQLVFAGSVVAGL